MRKLQRLDIIKELVSHHVVDTQEDIVAYLKERGIKATQATVSRDIKELGIVKVPIDGGYVYSMPKTVSTKLHANILGVERMDNMISLRAVPGTTSVTKREIVELFGSRLFSVLADDDSILAIARDEETAEELLVAIKAW